MSEKKPPNPYGRRGGPEHQKVVNEVFDDIDKRGFQPIKEFFLNLFGAGKKRFIDLAAKDGDDIIELHQVGKVNKNGEPVKRERDVIKEVQDEYGIDIKFHPYNEE